MNTHLDKLKDIIRKKLGAEFGALHIVDVAVREDVDPDGERILLIDVVFAAEPTGIDATVLASAVRMVRPSLIENDEDGFPVFSFIAQNEIGKGIRAGARSHWHG